MKNAERVLVRCNVFEHDWADAQVGISILMTPRNQDGTAPWSAVGDVTIVDNVVRDAASGFNIAGEDDLQPSQQTQRIVIANNVVYGLDSTMYGGDGRVWQVVTPNRPTLGLKIAHNTALFSGNATLAARDTGARRHRVSRGGLSERKRQRLSGVRGGRRVRRLRRQRLPARRHERLQGPSQRRPRSRRRRRSHRRRHRGRRAVTASNARRRSRACSPRPASGDR